MDEEINLSELLMVVLKRWYLIVISIGLLLIFFWLPQLSKKAAYEAKAALIINDEGAGSQAQISGLSNLLGIKSSSGSNVNFTVILSSRAVAEIVLDKLGLQKRIIGWDAPGVKRQDLISAVKGMPKFRDNSGLFEIVVVTESPTLSADVANGFAMAGAEYWRKLNYTEARKKREYIEGQLPRVAAELIRSENALKKFTIIAPPDAALKGIEMGRLERELDIQNSTYTMLRKEYEGAKLEESKELDTFSMIDPAEQPLKPLKSKIFLTFMIALVLGFFGGAALAFGLEMLNKPIKFR